jgi:hypothetical protein
MFRCTFQVLHFRSLAFLIRIHMYYQEVKCCMLNFFPSIFKNNEFPITCNSRFKFDNFLALCLWSNFLALVQSTISWSCHFLENFEIVTNDISKTNTILKVRLNCAFVLLISPRQTYLLFLSCWSSILWANIIIGGQNINLALLF